MADYGSEGAAEIRELQRSWLRMIATKHDTTPTGIARAAKLTPTTITRLVNDAAHPHLLSTASISKISKAFSEPAPNFGAVPTLEDYRRAVFSVVAQLVPMGALGATVNHVDAAQTILDLSDWMLSQKNPSDAEKSSVISFAARRLRRDG